MRTYQDKGEEKDEEEEREEKEKRTRRVCHTASGVQSWLDLTSCKESKNSGLDNNSQKTSWCTIIEYFVCMSHSLPCNYEFRKLVRDLEDANFVRGPISYGTSSQTQCGGSGLQRVYQLVMSEASVADHSSLDTGHGANGRVVYKVVLTGGTVKNTDHDGSVAAKILSPILFFSRSLRR